MATAKEEGSLNFVENRAQWPAPVRYRADVPGGALFLTAGGFTYSLYSTEDLHRIHELGHERPGRKLMDEPVRGHAYRVQFAGSRADVQLSASKKRDHYCNYFLGSDPQKWAGGVSVWGGVSYAGLYEGIDLHVYSVGASAKYDFIVAPGVDPAAIALAFDGVKPRLTAAGDLEIVTSVGKVVEQAPVAYQIVGGVHKKVLCNYVVDGTGTVHFAFPKGYDKHTELVIDPVLVFSTYSGSTATTYGYSATYDATGALYAGGLCFGAGWPVTTGAFQTTFGGGGTDASINKYNATGTTLIYSTYYGGSGGEGPSNMVVNAAGELIVVGSTSSANIATTPGCYDNTLGGTEDFFVAHFNATGTALIGATYVGGSGDDGSPSGFLSPNYGDGARGEVNVDASGNILVAGATSSANFPATAGAYQTALAGVQDGCVFQLNPGCTALAWATFLGGSDEDACFALERTSTGNLVVTGGTASTNFPTTAGVLHPTSQGGTDAFVAILSPTGSALTASTYLGTSSFDHGYKVQVAPGDTIYVLGQTDGAFPVTPGTYANAGANLFIGVLSPTLAVMPRSTVIGSAGTTVIPSAFLYDVCGNVYVCGYNFSLSGMPLTPNAHQTTPGGFWLCVLRSQMSVLDYGTYIGGSGDHLDGGSSRFDPQGIVYHSVCSSSPTAWSMPGKWSPTNNAGSYDVASFKFNFEAIGVVANVSVAAGSNDTGCAPHTVSFTNLSTSTATCVWDFGDGSPVYTGYSAPPHTYVTPGTYALKLYASVTSTQGCQGADTASLFIVVVDTSVLADADVVQDTVCYPDSIHFVNNSVGGATYEWDFGDGSPVSTATAPVHQYSPGIHTARLIASNPALCSSSDTDYVQVTIRGYGVEADFTIGANDSGCAPHTIPFINGTSGATSFLWYFGDGQTSTQLNPSHTYNATGTYIIKLVGYSSDPFICHPVDSTYDTVYVQVVQAPLFGLSDTLVCTPGLIAIHANALNTVPSTTYTWAPSPSIIGPLDSSSIVVNAIAPDSFILTVTNQFGTLCSLTAKDTLRLTIWDKPSVAGDTLICPADSATLSAIGGTAKLRWVPGWYLSSDTARITRVSPPAPMEYVLVSTYKHCRDTSREILVDVAPAALVSLPDSVHLYPGESYQMNPGTNALYFHWWPPLGLTADSIANPVAAPPVNTRYFITASTEWGCVVRDSIDVYVDPQSLLDIPNAFTPAGGPASPNNKLTIVRRGLATLRYFQVFNRWGQKVFETTDINEGWDGSFNGQPQPYGVYVYMVEAVTSSGRVWTKQGNVTLIR